MKKKALCLIITLLMTVSLLQSVAVNAASSINIGDYVRMGTYYGEPILWRCVDIDENGPLMLSDKIICLKPFDAKGTSTQGSHGRGSGYGDERRKYGSNYWADSNIRCWLNSLASAGNVNWTCGNPPDNDHVFEGYNDYADEAGFLTNFTQGEKNAIKEVTQKSLLDGYEYTSYLDFRYYHAPMGISDVLQNYDTAYSHNVTDKVFLLDVKQINTVYNNRGVLGAQYSVGEPTAQCVANSEYKAPNILKTEKKWHAWLRSPETGEYFGSYHVRIVGLYDRGIGVSGAYAYDGVTGVRPAFYLNLSSCTFTSGSGTITSPYTVYASYSNWGMGKAVYSNGKVSATVNTESVPEDSVVSMAIYDENKNLVSLTCESVKSSDSIIILLCDANESFIGNAIKIFIWDSLSGMKPFESAVGTIVE